MDDERVWVSGSISRHVDALDRGFLLGDGVFDTLVAFNGVPFAGEMHLERLATHADAIGVALDTHLVREGWGALLSNSSGRHVILRTTVTRGRTERGLWPSASPKPTVAVSTSPWSAQLVGRPVRLVVSATPRNAGSPLSRLKSTNYLDHVLAAREALDRGADDALFLTHAGDIACTTIANVFVIDGTNLLTPPETDGALAGVMRRLVLESAQSAGLHPVERSLRLDDLYRAGAVFLTNSVRFLSPVLSVDGRALAQGEDAARAALRNMIFDRVFRECGVRPE